MGWFENNAQHADALYGGQQQVTPHEGHFSHEAVAGGAAFFAMREWEQHEAASGRPVNHLLAKEVLAGLVGAEVDKLCETKGLDFLDRERAKHHARQQVTQMYDERHGSWQQEGQPFQQPQGGWGYPQMGGGYPQMGGYPPQMGGGYPQMGGYPPQMGGYPPQMGGGYPAQMGGGYPQMGGGYPQGPGGFPQGGGGYVDRY